MLKGLRKDGLFSGAFIYLISNILNAAIPFLLLPVLTRYLEPEGYGQVAMFQTLISALAAFTGLNTIAAANRIYYDDLQRQEMADYVSACVQILIVSSLLVFLAVSFFRIPLSRELGIDPFWILMGILVSAATFLVRLRLGQWQVRKQATKYGAMQIAMSLLNALVSLFLVVVLVYGPEGRMIGQSIAPLMIGLLALFLLRRDGLLSFSWKPGFIKDAMQFGVPLIPHVAGIFLLSMVDRLVVNKYLGLESAGIYMVAVQLTMVMGILFDAFNKAYMPWLFEKLKENDIHVKAKIVNWTYGYFLLALVIAVTVALLGPTAVVWLAGDRYSAAASIMGWLALGQAFNGMYLMVTNYMFYSKRTGILSVATISSGLLNLLLLVMLVPALGLEGAAMSFAIVMIIRFLCTWLLAQKCFPMPWFATPRIFIAKEISRFF
nr:oligosaccharide flippase family protein [uncultured Halomonas sp.]